MCGCGEMVYGEQVRALLNCSVPHLHYVSSSACMSCSHTWFGGLYESGVGELCRAIGPPMALHA